MEGFHPGQSARMRVAGRGGRGIVAGLFVVGVWLGGASESALGQRAERPAARGERGRDDDEAQRALDDVGYLERMSAAVARVARIARPSVVSVQTVMSGGGRQQRASGSGVIFDVRGHIVTSAHVLEGATQVDVVLADGRKLRAGVLGTDPKTDTAVLRVNATNLTPAKFADSSCVEAGNFVLAIGSPFRLSQTVSHGIVSATGRTNLEIEGIEYQNFIQTDAPTNPGNSGGALVNARGEVIGINTAIAGSGNFSGVAFATPSNTVTWAAQHIISGQPLVRGYMGIAITPLFPEIAERLGLTSAQGAYIEQVTPNSPAAKAGLHAEDIVLRIKKTQVCGSGQLQTLIAELAPGDRAPLTIWRDGQRRTVEVVVGEQPQNLSER